MKTTNSLTVFLMLCVYLPFIRMHAYAESFTVRCGTLEHNPDLPRSHIFKWDGHEDVFHMMSAIEILGSSGPPTNPAIPNLVLRGARMKSGAVYDTNKTLAVEEALISYLDEHPKEKIATFRYEGETDEPLEMNLLGLTPVCRIDWGNTVFWKNLPEKADSKVAPNSNSKGKDGTKGKKFPWDIPPVYRVRLGTLEIQDAPERRFLFHGDENDDEIFEGSVKPAEKTALTNFLKVSGLKEIGVKTVSGKIFKYEDLAPEVFLQEFPTEHTDETIEALILNGKYDENLVIPLKGSVRVCRLDLSYQRKDERRALWKNLPEVPEIKAKTNSNANDETKAKIEK